jgi:hypothetical protein
MWFQILLGCIRQVTHGVLYVPYKQYQRKSHLMTKALSFTSLSSTREEYVAVLQQVKASTPQAGPNGHRTKSDLLHVDLANKLEQRIEFIDAHCEVSSFQFVEASLSVALKFFSYQPHHRIGSCQREGKKRGDH